MNEISDDPNINIANKSTIIDIKIPPCIIHLKTPKLSEKTNQTQQIIEKTRLDLIELFGKGSSYTKKAIISFSLFLNRKLFFNIFHFILLQLAREVGISPARIGLVEYLRHYSQGLTTHLIGNPNLQSENYSVMSIQLLSMINLLVDSQQKISVFFRILELVGSGSISKTTALNATSLIFPQYIKFIASVISKNDINLLRPSFLFNIINEMTENEKNMMFSKSFLKLLNDFSTANPNNALDQSIIVSTRETANVTLKLISDAEIYNCKYLYNILKRIIFDEEISEDDLKIISNVLYGDASIKIIFDSQLINRIFEYGKRHAEIFKNVMNDLLEYYERTSSDYRFFFSKLYDRKNQFYCFIFNNFEVTYNEKGLVVAIKILETLGSQNGLEKKQINLIKEIRKTSVKYASTKFALFYYYLDLMSSNFEIFEIEKINEWISNLTMRPPPYGEYESPTIANGDVFVINALHSLKYSNTLSLSLLKACEKCQEDPYIAKISMTNGSVSISLVENIFSEY